MLPTVVVAAGFSALLGPRGLVHVLLPSLSFNFIGTLPAILIAHVFYNTTIIIRVVGNALSSLDPRLEAAARSLGADSFHVWWNVTFPCCARRSWPPLCLSFSSISPVLASSFCWAARSLPPSKWKSICGFSSFPIFHSLLAFGHSAGLHDDGFDPVCPHGFPLHHSNRAALGSREYSQTKNAAGKNFCFRADHSACFFFFPASFCSAFPFPLPPRSGPRSARRSSIWVHHGLLH